MAHPPAKHPRLLPRARAGLKGAVLRAARELLTAGYPPSESRLRDAIPGRGVHLMIALRDELIREGAIDWRPGQRTARGGVGCGAIGTARGLTAADDLDVVARILEVQREKIARGERPVVGPLAVDFWRHHRDFHDRRR